MLWLLQHAAPSFVIRLRRSPMARRKRFSIFAAGTAAIIGLALYLPGGAPFINGYPVATGYGGNQCPVGLSFDASPNTVVFGHAFAISGQLVSGAPTALSVSGKSIPIK